MEKIKEIAHKGNEYEFGVSGDDDIKFVKLNTGFLLLQKVRPDIVTVFLNTGLNDERIEASGDFTGFEGYTKMLLCKGSSTEISQVYLYVKRTGIVINLDPSVYSDLGASCAGIYRIESTK